MQMFQKKKPEKVKTENEADKELKCVSALSNDKTYAEKYGNLLKLVITPQTSNEWTNNLFRRLDSASYVFLVEQLSIK